MDYLQRFTGQFRNRLALLLLANSAVILADWWLTDKVFGLTGWWLVLCFVLVPLLAIVILPLVTTSYFTRPMRTIWQAILHIAPNSREETPAPSLESIGLGKDMLTALTGQLYEFVAVSDAVANHIKEQGNDLGRNPVATNLPLPLLVLDKELKVVFANGSAASYLGLSAGNMAGKDVYSVLDMSFHSSATFDAWLAEVRSNAVTAVKTWENVRIILPDSQKSLQLDLAAYYNKDNPLGHELMLILFDHTARYSADDQAMSLVALAVHELRTPLTLLRGYIEALEEKAAGKLDTAEIDYLHKMDAAGQQLVAFINNVLSVARIEDEQFLVKLHEESWPAIIESSVVDMKLRAGVRGITIESAVAPNLPPVGVDRVGMYEVIVNLIDNAIKYSPSGRRIIIKSDLNSDGLIQTDVQDSGIGIPDNIVDHLFDKFYRSHRSRSQVSGTGIGLYLCKTIVNAHGGNIWVRSAEGKGSIFSFTVLPYARLAAELKDHPEDLTRTAHGWIKNHSLYRR